MEAADRVDSAPTLTLEALEAQLTELAAHIYAGTYRWLCLLREFDERGDGTAGASIPARTG